MSVDPNKFGLSDSLLGAVTEALKGGQKKIDVAPPFGKLTGADFKKLRGEEKKAQMAAEVADGNAKNFKANMKEGPEEKDKTNPKQGSSVNPKQREIDEVVGAPVPNMAAAMDSRRAEVQRKIAQKQASHQQAKARARIKGTVKEGDKCSCGDTNESKMKCEVHGGKDKGDKGKGGREAIVMNPPLKEAGELPKKVITKGHEIAKSLIKHRAKVKSPYAVGMATAKKSAGIKEEAEQVDEVQGRRQAGAEWDYNKKQMAKGERGSAAMADYKNKTEYMKAATKKKKTNEEVDESVYPERHAAAKKIIGDVAKKKGGKVGFQSTSFKNGKKVTVHGYHDEKGERHVTHTTTED